MIKSGPVYDGQNKRREVNVSVRTKWLPVVAKIMSFGGLLMVLAAVVGLVGIYVPLGLAEVRYAWTKSDLGKLVQIMGKQVSDNKKVAKGEAITVKGPVKPTWEVPDLSYSIYIPKIEAVSRVIPSVDAENTKEYLAALQKGVAEAAGLSHPGEKGTTYLFAHSVGSRVDYARYNAVFYLLDKVNDGDKVEIVYKDKLYGYEVVSKEILAANDVQYLIPQKLSEKLILQTCYPPGTSWKRLIVIGKRIY